MNRMSMELEDNRHGFCPGETIRGHGSWGLDKEPERIEASLFWHTSGKAPSEVVLVQSIVFPHPSRTGQRDFEFQIPWGPYSFQGRYILLSWAIELVAFPLKRAARIDITVSPSQEPIQVEAQ